MEFKNDCNVCTKNTNILSIDLADYSHICRYHKYPSRQHYENNLIAPKGMCMDLFHSAYPTCLSLLYSGKYNDKVIISCPNPEANVHIEVEKHSTKTKYLRKFAVWVLSKFGCEIEFPDRQIIMIMKSEVPVCCLYPYKKGHKFKFNIWTGRELCPATFDAIYPSVHNLMRGGYIPWQIASNNTEKVVCPDPKSNITMLVTKKKKQSTN